MPPTDLGMPGFGLFEEAKRQLDVCNSCRYCAGYCPVWPALELRVDMAPADARHLANLCHDCRDCFSACMYTAPHEFDLNPPALFAAIREETYAEYVRPRFPLGGRARAGAAAAVLAIAAVVVVALAAMTDPAGSGTAPGDPYSVVGHGLLVGAALVPAAFGVLVILLGNARFWRETYGPLAQLRHVRAWAATLGQAATLRHQTAAGHGCDYPDEEPGGARRIWHQSVVIGFLLTLVATTSAALLEYFGGQQPPYPYLSVPVVTGTVGGVVTIVGCAGLMLLKRRSDVAQSTTTMRRADYALIAGLLLVNLTGLFVLATRTTGLFEGFLVAHLAVVLACFAVAPYTKFVHWTFRVLAIYADNAGLPCRPPG